MAQRQQSSSALHGSMRTILLVAVLSYYCRKYLYGFFFPYGLPVPIPMSERVSFATIDKSNDSLQAKHGKLTKIVERLEEGQEPLLKGPETILVGPADNVMYAFARGAKLVRLDEVLPTDDPHTKTAKVTVAAELGHGTPLGGKFTPDGDTLYVADPLLGLTRIRNFTSSDKKTVELVVNKVMDNGVLTPLLYADDVAIGPKTGKVYFSDATEIAPDRKIQERDWDVLYASKLDSVRGKKTGRLLEYDPETEQVRVLARNFHFANGVAVDKEETYVVISQTFAMRLSKYNLATGTLETVIDSHQLAGYTDGADCSWDESGKCYVAVPTPIVPVMRIMTKVPPPLDQFLRTLLLMLPKSLAPQPVDYGCVVEVDMTTGSIRTLQDPDARDMKFLTGVTVHDNKLYLGGLHSDVVGIYDLS